MDSKLLRRALLLVTLFVAFIFILILWLNGIFVPKQDSSSGKNASTDTVADESGMIIGSDLDAWKSDETFFDAKKIGDGTYENEAGIGVVLTASSVEKDLRIRILDDKGKLISGKKFTVTIGNTMDVTDEDMDGVIHVTDLTPGDYTISMAMEPGYVVPTTPLICNVKAKIDYRVIDDISYLIKTEAEIDPEVDDTAVNDAATETMGVSSVKTVDGAVFGIDVSKYNGYIDWDKVKASGVDFCIIRCGYRGSSTGAIVEDPYFRTNIAGATAAGIKVGVYFFTQATNSVEAIEEASAAVNLVEGYKLSYPIFIDSEGAGGRGRADNLDVNTRSDILQTFCETVRNGGYTAGVYASKNWFKNRLDITRLSADNVIWLAEYNDAVSYDGTYQMWQYSSNGSVDGIEGRVDMNLSYLDMAEN